MPQTPANTPFSFTPQQIERLNACDRPDQVPVMIEQFLLENNQAARNSSGEVEVVIPEPAAPAPKTFSEVVEIPGVVKGTISAESELELAKKVGEFYRDRMGWAKTDQTQKRDAAGKFVAQPEELPMPADEQELMAATQELRMQLVRGELVAEEFVSKKAELEAGLQTTRDWAEAVEHFRNSDAGADWPGADFVGGEINLATMQATLAAHDLLDAEDKLSAIAGVWDFMKRTGQFVERPASPEEIAEQIGEAAARAEQQEQYEKEISAATSASEVQEINSRFGLRPERDSSSLFGR